MAGLDDETVLQQKRVRQVGSGGKTAFETIDGLNEAFLRVLEYHTAGSPMDETLKWRSLKRHEIVVLLRHTYQAAGNAREYGYKKEN